MCHALFITIFGQNANFQILYYIDPIDNIIHKTHLFLHEKNDVTINFLLLPLCRPIMGHALFDHHNLWKKFESQDFELYRQYYTLNPLIFVQEKRSNCSSLVLLLTIVEANIGLSPF